MNNKVEGTSPNYQTVLNYIQKQVRLNWFGEIIVPPVLLTSEALKLPLEQVEEVYTELLARGILCEVSEYQFTIGGYFPLTEEIKRRVGTISSRR